MVPGGAGRYRLERPGSRYRSHHGFPPEGKRPYYPASKEELRTQEARGMNYFFSPSTMATKASMSILSLSAAAWIFSAVSTGSLTRMLERSSAGASSMRFIAARRLRSAFGVMGRQVDDHIRVLRAVDGAKIVKMTISVNSKIGFLTIILFVKLLTSGQNDYIIIS
jgi:hypothetical protein